MAILTGMHVFKAISQLDPSGIFWVDDAPRAVVLALLATSGLAALVSRVVPAFTGRTDATSEALVADVELPEAELPGATAFLPGSQRSVFLGKLSLAGAALCFLALLAVAALPLFHGQGLDRGGELKLSVGRPAEAALVDVGGLKVKKNLGGLILELVQVNLGRLGKPG